MKLLIKKLLPSKLVISIQYRRVFKKKLNWSNLETFNEKIQYIKLYQKDELYTICADKVGVKDYIKEKIGASYVIPTLDIWNNFDEINFDLLPMEFVLKTNHDYAGVYVCKDKSLIDKEVLRKKFEKHLNTNFYHEKKEWAYKNIKPKIFAEKLLKDKQFDDIIDYKFFCFNGKVDSVMICQERMTGYPKFYFLDKEWELKPFNNDSIVAINEGKIIEKPENIENMFKVATTLSESIPFVRVDLYNVNGEIYFGEMTFYPSAGYDNKLLADTDRYYGNLIDLSLIEKK